MKNRNFGKRFTSVLLAYIMTLTLLLPLSFTGAEALETNAQYPRGEIITGSDFSEFSDVTELIDPDADYTAMKDASGEVYMTFYHPWETGFSVLSDGGNCFIRADMFHIFTEQISSGISFSLSGKLWETDASAGAADFVTDISVRYPDFVYQDTPCELDLIGLSGTYRGEKTYFSPVKMNTNNQIIYYNGSEYVDSGIMLTEHQWKNISVAWHFTDNTGIFPTMDIYINQMLVAEGVLAPVGFDTVDSADAVYYAGDSSYRSMRTDIDYFWIYNGTEPEFGLYPEADPAALTAELDLSLLENGRIYSETVKNDAFSLSPLGNTFQVLSAGKNRYLAVNHTVYRPCADIYSQKETIGTSQVAELAVRLGSSWNGEATLLAPFSTDESGIRKQVELLTIDSAGILRLKSSGALLGSVGSETYTVISVVISFDRTAFDVYIDGRAVVLGEALPEGLDKIDGVRLFGIDSAAVSAGSLYIDYGVMYSGALPAGAEDGTEIYYENTFDSADGTDIAPLTAEGAGVIAEKDGNGFRLTYPAGADGGAAMYLPINKASAPIYVDFMFSYTKLSSDILLVSFTGGGENIYTAAALDKEGTLYAYSGAEKRSGIKLISGKSYRITVIGNPENGFASVYVNGSPELSFSLADNLDDTDGVRLMSIDRLGSSKVYMDDLSVYRSYRKLGAKITDPALNFTAQTTQIGDILIEWESAGPAARYTVWRSTSELAPQTKICELTDSLSFTDIDVTENRTYYYTVCITYLREGKEYYYGYGEKLLKVTAVLPPEPEKPSTPSGELPSYTAITVISDDFSESDTILRLGSDKCYIERSTQTLKLLNEAGSMDIPYFAVDNVGARRAAIFDFELTVNKNLVSVNLASVYSDAKKITDIVKLSGEKLLLSDDTELCTLQSGKSCRLTVWIDADCSAAAVFIDGVCVASDIDIPSFVKTDNAYTVRFCSIIGEASVSVDNFSYLETRAFISDYTANPLLPYVSVRSEGNSITWDNVRGCKYFTLWSCGSLDGRYTVLADNLEATAYTDSGVTSTRYYKVTYTFDTLGVELTVPLSSAAAAERGSQTGVSVPPFLDFGNTGSLYTFIIFIVGALAVVALLVPVKIFNIKKKEKKENSSDDN